MINIGVIGAGGRLGSAIRQALDASEGLSFAGGNDHGIAADWGMSLDGLCGGADLVIDVAAPGSTAEHVTTAARSRIPYIVGTTGLSDTDHQALDAAADQIPVLQTGNFSLGVTLLASLVEAGARALKADGWDIEIVESHHRNKVDSPSGTALLLGEAAARGRDISLDDNKVGPHDGIHGIRPEGVIGFASIRGGSVIGEHSVQFLGAAERIELSHKAEDRALFAHGALAAARFLSDAKPGRYDMRDVIGGSGAGA